MPWQSLPTPSPVLSIAEGTGEGQGEGETLGLLRGVYPEQDEILRSAQNDRRRRARNDT